MARMSRSQTDIRSQNAGLAQVRTQSFNHNVGMEQSKSAGLDPMRGDLTSAFNNFFGGVQQSLETMQQTQFQADKVKATEHANNMKMAASNEAMDYSVNNPKQTNVTTALATESPENNANKHFVKQYKATLGQNIGNRLYSDFIATQAEKHPSTFEANSQSFWEENFADGTGDVETDFAMTTAFNRNYENNRVSAAQETVRRTKAAAALEHKRSIFIGVGNLTTEEELNNLLHSGTPKNGETHGQLSSRNIGILIEAAQGQDVSSNALLLIQGWIDKQPVAEDGTLGQSPAQRFPQMANKLELMLPAIAARNATLKGEKVAEDSFLDFTTNLAGIDDKLEKIDFVTSSGPAMIELLQNTPGVSGATMSALKTKVSDMRTAGTVYKGNRNNWQKMGMGQAPSATFDGTTDEAKAALYDQFNASNAETKGTLLRSAIDNYGIDVIPDRVKSQMSANITQGEAGAATDAATTILSLVGKFGDNRKLESILSEPSIAIWSNAQALIDGGTAVSTAMTMARGPGYAAAAEMFDEAGGLAGVFFGDEKKSDQDAAISGLAQSEEMLTALETYTQGIQSGFMRFVTIQDGVNVSAQSAQQINRLVKTNTIAAMMRGDEPDLEKIMGQVAKTMAGKMYIEDGAWQISNASLPTNNPDYVRVGPSVLNRNTGEGENTHATIELDIEVAGAGLYGIDQDTFTPENLYFQQDPMSDNNGHLIWSRSDNTPIMLQTGSDLDLDPGFKADGEIWGFWNAGAFRSEFKKTVQLTGNLADDMAMMKTTLGPGLSLSPIVTNGAVIGYNLIATPRLTGKPKYTDEELELMRSKNMSPFLPDGTRFVPG